jgi:hypothetical protein
MSRSVRKLLLPFFMVRLVLSLTPFLLQIGLMIISPYLGLGLLLLMIVLYSLAWGRLVFKAASNNNQLSVQPGITELSPTSQQLQQQVVTNYPHKLVYRDDPYLLTLQQTIQQQLLFNNSHRDLLLTAGILAEVLPLSPTLASSAAHTSDYFERAAYVDPNHPLVISL